MIYALSDVVGTSLEETKANIQQVIDLDRESSRHSAIKAGVEYYRNDNDILRKEQYYYKDGKRLADETKSNNKLSHSFYGLLVKQKVGYLLGKPMNLNSRDSGVNDYLKSVLGDKWNSTAQKLLKNASNKGDEWLYCYIDRDGYFNYTLCPTEQIIPLYNNGFKTYLEGIIRYYDVTNLAGEVTTKVEFWTSTEVSYFEDNGGLELVETRPHFTVNGKGYSFGCVPFVQFKNNDENMTDLSMVKDLIDNYDAVTSGLANDLEDIQDCVYVLKGYQGTDSSEFMDNLRYYKLIKVDDDGGVNKLEVHIPIEAKEAHLKRLEDDIYRLGMGVDVSSEKLGNSSGVALKFIYSLLDLKADMAEVQFKKGIRHFLKVISSWYGVINGTPFDWKEVKVTLNRSLIINTKEQIVNVANSLGLLSKETLLSNHPFVTDVDFEISQMEKEGINFPTSPDDTAAGKGLNTSGGDYERHDPDDPNSQNK